MKLHAFGRCSQKLTTALLTRKRQTKRQILIPFAIISPSFFLSPCVIRIPNSLIRGIASGIVAADVRYSTFCFRGESFYFGNFSNLRANIRQVETRGRKKTSTINYPAWSFWAFRYGFSRESCFGSRFSVFLVCFTVIMIYTHIRGSGTYSCIVCTS